MKNRVLILLVAIFAVLPLSNNILCIESDSSFSIEIATLGNCDLQDVSTDDHEECHDCTDVSLQQDVSSKSQNNIDYGTLPVSLYEAVTVIESFVYKEPLSKVESNNSFYPNLLHEIFQTIILVI